VTLWNLVLHATRMSVSAEGGKSDDLALLASRESSSSSNRHIADRASAARSVPADRRRRKS
jgi:hypothetical protein